MERKIIISILIFFFASSIFLIYHGEKDKDPNFQKNWWITYFRNPSAADLNFTIENHSNSEKFTWRIIKNKQTIKESEVLVKKGDIKDVEISDIEQTGKVIIEVESAGDKKQIYRNF